MRRGLALIEVAIAFVILGLAVVPILNLFFGTSKLQTRTQSYFREAVAGQLVWERLKGRVLVDPHFLRDLPTAAGFEARDVPHPLRPFESALGLVHLGAFVEQGGPLDDSDRPLPLSPFAAFLVNRARGDLYAPGNRASLDAGPSETATAEELASLRKNYQDLAVKVTIAEGLLPAWKPGQPADVPHARSELVRDVAIEVYRAGPDRRLSGEPAFRLVTTLETPHASLSLSALRALRESTDDYDYEREIRVAARGVRQALGRSAMGDGMARVAADLVLISIESVGEAVLSEGRDLGFNLRDGNSGKGSEFLVEKLGAVDSAVARLAAADLLAEQSRGIFQAYRRSEKPMQVLNAYTGRFSPRIRSVVKAMSKLMRVHKTSGTPAEREQARERVRVIATGFRKTLTQLGFWARLLGSERWLSATLRPFTYPQRYADALARAQALYRAAEAHPRATPMDRLRAINGFVEVTKARKLYLNAPTLADDEAWVRGRIDALAPSARPFTEGLASDDLFTAPALAARNDKFRRLVASMQDAMRPEASYAMSLKTLHPRGRLLDYRRRLGEVFDYFGLPEFTNEINRDIGELVEQVRDSDFPPAPGADTVTADDGPLPTDGDGEPDE